VLLLRKETKENKVHRCMSNSRQSGDKRFPLAIKHSHARDKRISFNEETHTYTVDENPCNRYANVTSVIGTLFSSFDKQKAAENIVRKHFRQQRNALKRKTVEKKACNEMHLAYQKALDGFSENDFFLRKEELIEKVFFLLE